MTEELKQEAEEKYNTKYKEQCEHIWKGAIFSLGYLASAEPREKRIAELEQQIEKMKKYGKLLQDICVVLGNDNFMVSVQLESVVKKLWDKSEEEEGFKMVDDILNRLLEIKPQEWAEIEKWEIKEK